MPEDMCFQCIKSLKMGFCEEQKSLKAESELSHPLYKDDCYIFSSDIPQISSTGYKFWHL